MGFCNKCGSGVSDEAAFCRQCGSRVDRLAALDASTSVAPPTSPSASPLSEGCQQAPVQVAPSLVLFTSKRLGFFKSVNCYLVFHDHELMLAHLGKESEKSAMEQYRREQKEEGRGFLGTMLAMADFWRGYGQRYREMSREEILSDDPQNTALSYASMTKVVFRTARHYDDGSGSTSKKGGVMEIHGPFGKLQFSHDYFDSKKNIKSILTARVGQVLKYKAPLFSGAISIGGSSDMID